jgi:hypothetical protein
MRSVRIALVSIVAAVLVAVFGFATVVGARTGEVMGYVARKGDASISAEDQTATAGSAVVAKVVAPAPSWVIVHLDAGGGKPGKRIGYVHVDKGVTTEVKVPLDAGKLTPELLVAVHADRGEAGALEFDMEAKEKGPDKPYFVDGKEVATKFAIK